MTRWWKRRLFAWAEIRAAWHLRRADKHLALARAWRERMARWRLIAPSA